MDAHCAPIAVQTRLTLYWYLKQIIGPAGMVVYNLVNAVLYCALGGAMITVAASALRIPFGIPDQVNWYPEDLRFVLVVLGIGAVVVTLAILGFKRLAQFSTVCSPWMIVMFVAGALATLPLLGDARSWSGFWQIANERIWQLPAGKEKAIGFWHIVAFAWACNLGMHLGLTDMALFRYAKRSAYGLYSSTGMFLGHYVSWICAGIMGAVAAVVIGKPLTELDSGSVATTALGGIGALVVVIAGWTTANPMLYRSGLAFQVISPGWPRWRVTLIAGVITTIFACSPFIFTKMLDFVVVYGLILMPMGAIVVLEHWLFPRLGWNRFWAARKGLLINCAGDDRVDRIGCGRPGGVAAGVDPPVLRVHTRVDSRSDRLRRARRALYGAAVNCWRTAGTPSRRAHARRRCAATTSAKPPARKSWFTTRWAKCQA